MSVRKAQPMLQIGASKDAIKEAHLAVVEILKIGTKDRESTVAALNSLATICQVTNTTITSCSFKNE